MIEEIDGSGKTILIIGDTHIPYSHWDYIKFLEAIKNKYKPDIVLHIGDELDYHAISFHNSDASLLSAGHELDKSIEEIKTGLHRLFPKMKLLESNHGSLIYRRMKAEGIPIRTLKPLNELYETPLWSWHHELLLKTNLGPIYLCHGKSGVYGKLCKEMGCSTIQGHFHGKLEVTWHKSSTGMRFNAFTGCLVDYNGMAMAYGRNNIPKPLLGSLLIDSAGLPWPMHMLLNEKGNWDGAV